MFRYFIIYKPFQVLSQFTSEDGKKTLKDFFSVTADIYPVGRLDFDSEGLLLLTNDKQLNHRLLNPLFQHEREYWVQVDGIISPTAIEKLEAGVSITVDSRDYQTKKCKAEFFPTPPDVPERIPPIRFRKHIPTSWIRMILTEGKNRQVRKMTAAAGYPTLRLIRVRIGDLKLDELEPGEMRELSKNYIYSKLFSRS
jgi:23S rRNA pseudouridine2457 synthase